MSNAVDLTMLSAISGGNEEFEKKVFKEFIISFEEKLKIMNEQCRDGESIDWQNTAHSIKGISGTIGANKLSELCSMAHDNSNADVKTKNSLLLELRSEYVRVKHFLKNL